MNKQDLLAEIPKDLPSGILDFLTTPLPAGPQLTAPGDVDSAIKCQAEFCVWMGELFGQFEGLTPISIPMFIGQLNTVQHAMLLASLEGKALPVDEEGSGPLVIVEPESGGSYLPGDLRITATVEDGIDVTGITGTVGGIDVEMALNDDGRWQAGVTISEQGEYNLKLTAAVADGDPLTASATFAMSEDGEQPAEGADEASLQDAYTQLGDAIRRLYDIPDITSIDGIKAHIVNTVKFIGTCLETLGSVASKVVQGEPGEALNQLISEMTNYWQELWNLVTTFDDKVGDGKMSALEFCFSLMNPLGKLGKSAAALKTLLATIFI